MSKECENGWEVSCVIDTSIIFKRQNKIMQNIHIYINIKLFLSIGLYVLKFLKQFIIKTNKIKFIFLYIYVFSRFANF